MQITIEKLDAHSTRRARAAIGADGDGFEMRDKEVPGLSIRGRKRSATWILRGRLGDRQSTWTIGSIDKVSLTEARDRASKSKDMLRRGEDPKPWLQERELGGPKIAKPAKDERMTFGAGVELFLDFVNRERRPATYDDYRKTLRGRDCSKVHDRAIASITADDVRIMRDSIEKRAPSQAEHTVRIMKACLAWLADSPGTGLRESPALTVRPRRRGGDHLEELGRLPSLEELGQVAWNLESCGLPTARLAGALVLFTAQRVHTVCNARVSDFAADPSGRGGVWTIPRALMKNSKKVRRPHIVPLSEEAWGVVEQARALVPAGSAYLFPQTRPRRAGDPGDGCISRKPVADALTAAGGAVRPHDIRRAFATYCEAPLGISVGDIRRVLDHAEGRGGDVMRTHYSQADSLHRTRDVMRTWSEFVMRLTGEHGPTGSG